MSTRQLRAATGLPVLGTVSMQIVDTGESSDSVYPFMVVASSLLAVFALIMIIEILAATNETIYGYVQNLYWQLNAMKGG